MQESDLPTTLTDFVTARLAELSPAARLAVVFDPYADLALAETLEVETSTSKGMERTWQVVHYDGNDLAFRQQFKPQPGLSHLIWVTTPAGARRDDLVRLELRSMADVWQQAELFIDASLPGVLRQLAPQHTWPEAPVWEQASILSRNLPAVVTGWQELRLRLGRPASLDVHMIRALALHCLQPNLPIDRFMFRFDTPARVMGAYLDLLWSVEWQPAGLSLLQQQAREASKLDLSGDTETWLNLPPSTLALYIYLRRLLGRFRLPNVANQLRGLGLLDVDAAALEAGVGSVLTRWDNSPAWRKRIILQAERALSAEDINRVIDLLALDSPEAAFEALRQADTPATIAALQATFFQHAIATQQAHRYTPTWRDSRPSNLGDLPETGFLEPVQNTAWILDEIAFVDSRLPLQPPEKADIARLLDWYIEQELYDLEYAHARASSRTLYVKDEQLKADFEAYLKWQKKMIREFLDDLDHRLAGLITTDWPGYLSHPRLSINLLWDTVKKSRRAISTQSRLWVVVFDGMRWDTWARHVKPRLLETFELVEPEKAYLSLLPSWTMIARTGLLAGKLPDGWRDQRQVISRDQAFLAARLFDVPRGEQDRRLQFFSNVESDRKYMQLQPAARYPYNVLVFNISDDNLHNQRGSLSDLNKVVNTLLDDILQNLKNLIEPEDVVVISSDHGFVELESQDGVTVPDDQRWLRYQSGGAHPVRYRYLTTHDAPDLPDIYKVNYQGLPDKFTVAVGRHWFKRADSRGQDERYAHGGLSLAEMTVPGAILKLITEKRVKPALIVQPAKLEMQEKETVLVTLLVSNKGNVPLTGQLIAEADAPNEPASYAIELRPGEEDRFSYSVTAYYRTRDKKTNDSTQQVKITLNYTDLNGEKRKTSKRIPVTVKPRVDVVELSFGDLPDIDI